MTPACRTAVHAATGKVFSDAEVDGLVDRLAQKARRKFGADPSAGEKAAIGEAAAELTREEAMAALQQRRLELAAKIARDGRRAKLDAMPAKMDEAQRLQAFDVGSERQGWATGASIDAEGRARSAELIGQVALGLAQKPGALERIANPFGFGDRSFDRLVVRERARLNGAGEIEPTGDETALHVARVLNAASNAGRQMQNGLGAWIGELKGYAGRQSHDRLKVAGGFWRELGAIGDRLRGAKSLSEARAAIDWQSARVTAAKRAFRQWRDFILPRLDPKTFDGLELQDVPFTKWEDEAQEARQLGRQRDLKDADLLSGRGVIDDPNSLQERMLYHVWFDIVTGRRESASGGDDLADFRPPASLARSVSKARVLQFKDPDAWFDYNERYGRGSVYSSAIGELDRAGRNSALMKAYGPAPEAARAAEVDRLSNDARQRGDPGAVAALNSRKTQASFDALTGRLNAPENLRFAMVVRSIRTVESLSKLGSMVLSKTTDLPMAAHTMKRAGATFLDGYRGSLAGIARLESDDAKHVAELLHVGTRAFAGEMMGRFHGPDGPMGWGSWMSRLHYKANGFDFVNEGVREGAAIMYSRHLGLQADKSYDALNPGTRETFERFGIDSRAWDLARKGLEPAADGAIYWTPEALDRVGDTDLHRWAGLKGDARTPEAAQRARGDLALRFTTMIHNVIDDAVSEPRAREQVSTTAGLKAGTLWGEAARSMSQFHGFIRTILGRHLAPAAAGYAGASPVALMAHFIVGSALAGFLSLEAKQLVAGRDPRDPADPHTWEASLVQGGGLGIYGDFLFGEENRSGVSATLDSFGGPTLSDAEQVASLVRHAVHGDDPNWVGEATRFGTTHLPLVNLWYTRLALDYLVLWRLQEASSPGYLARYEERVREKQGTDFWLHPSMVNQ